MTLAPKVRRYFWKWESDTKISMVLFLPCMVINLQQLARPRSRWCLSPQRATVGLTICSPRCIPQLQQMSVPSLPFRRVTAHAQKAHSSFQPLHVRLGVFLLLVPWTDRAQRSWTKHTVFRVICFAIRYHCTALNYLFQLLRQVCGKFPYSFNGNQIANFKPKFFICTTAWLWSVAEQGRGEQLCRNRPQSQLGEVCGSHLIKLDRKYL